MVASEDAATRQLQQLQLQRQQQQEALRLRMLQQQGAAQAPQRDAGRRQSIERLQVEQQQRQDQSHYRQAIEPAPALPGDDAGVREAKREAARQNAGRESETQLQRFDRELGERRRNPRPLLPDEAAAGPDFPNGRN